MSVLYTTEDKQLFESYVDDISNKSFQISQNIIGPTMNEIKKIQNIILTYIKNKKRVIYGGFALNLLLKYRGETFLYNIGFDNNCPFTRYEIPDIDCYSPEPREDMIAICDLLFKEDIKFIEGKEAQHVETYKVFAYFKEFCNFSYMNTALYNSIPKIKFTIKGYDVIMLRPDIASIDLLRIMTDPIGSYRLLEKQFNRLYYLQTLKDCKYGTHEKRLTEYNVIKYEIPDKIKNSIYNFVKNNDTLTMFGYFAYDVYSKKIPLPKNPIDNYVKNRCQTKDEIGSIFFSDVCSRGGGKKNKNYIVDKDNIVDKDDKKIMKNYKYQFYSSDYKNCIPLIYSKLKKEYGDKITIREYYPFFQYLGHRTSFYYEDINFLDVYDNYEKCIPYKKLQIEQQYFGDKVKIEKDDYVNICTFAVNVSNLLMLYVYDKVYNHKRAPIHDNMIKDLIKFKKVYLEEHKKTIFDDTIYQEFVINCIGKTIKPELKKWNLGKKRIEMKKRPVYKYNPSPFKKEDATVIKFVYANSSGNKIKNDKKYMFKDIPHKVEIN